MAREDAYHKYADHAARHLRAWFVDDATRMNPSLLYAQAIKGRFTGRGTGIIDTLHLVEVARAAWQIGLKPADLDGVKKWFASYSEWLTTHGLGERPSVVARVDRAPPQAPRNENTNSSDDGEVRQQDPRIEILIRRR